MADIPRPLLLRLQREEDNSSKFQEQGKDLDLLCPLEEVFAQLGLAVLVFGRSGSIQE